ncbi:MAG: hypothetical protein RL141_956 [Candidatus Parcubacteria bacterium]|jgi:hypothetical protein
MKKQTCYDTYCPKSLMKIFRTLVIPGLFLGIFFLFGSQISTSAAGVNISLSDGSGTADAGSGGQTEITTSWTTSGFYTTGTYLTLTVSPAATSTLSECGTPDYTFANTGDLTVVTSSWSTSAAVYAFTQNVSTSTAGAVCVSYGVTTTTASNYSITALVTSSTTAFSTTDFGAALYYVLGGNQVQVTATVPASLSFSIRNSADTAATNVCQLGTLSLTSVSTCTYRLRIATNAASGFSATIQADKDFSTPAYATMTSVVNDASFVAGTEAYGISVLTAATEGGRQSTSSAFTEPIVESNFATTTFIVDASPVPVSSAGIIISFPRPFNVGAAPSTTTTSAVTHAAAISAGTAVGVYSHTVTYRVTGSF